MAPRRNPNLVPIYCECKGTPRKLVETVPTATVYTPTCKDREGLMYPHTVSNPRPFKPRAKKATGRSAIAALNS